MGRRMGADQPKQHLKVDQRTLVEVTLSRFIGLPGLKGAVLALAPNDELTPKLLASFSAFALHFTAGGASRSDSVLAALNYLSGQLAVDRQHWVLVHDAARPCVRTEDVHKLLEAVRGSNAGGLLAVPVRKPLLVKGHADNLKVTHPDDLPLARLILQAQDASQSAWIDDASTSE
ncbi:MAG: hypothetical protein B7X37_09885 [Halothiobacillus sp. 14-55-98]|nr:MAG: hypothetical protein B7X37_09885 [Halothiobacillus sp. 14-55-98]